MFKTFRKQTIHLRKDANCINNPGSFECECKPGYEGDGIFCFLDDECLLNLDVCNEHATCTNTEEGYECACNDGFLGDGYSCEDTDECENRAHGCDKNAQCSNSFG